MALKQTRQLQPKIKPSGTMKSLPSEEPLRRPLRLDEGRQQGREYVGAPLRAAQGTVGAIKAPRQGRDQAAMRKHVSGHCEAP